MHTVSIAPLVRNNRARRKLGPTMLNWRGRRITVDQRDGIECETAANALQVSEMAGLLHWHTISAMGRCSFCALLEKSTKQTRPTKHTATGDVSQPWVHPCIFLAKLFSLHRRSEICVPNNCNCRCFRSALCGTKMIPSDKLLLKPETETCDHYLKEYVS